MAKRSLESYYGGTRNGQRGDAAFCSACDTDLHLSKHQHFPPLADSNQRGGSTVCLHLLRGWRAFRIPPCQACSPQLALGQISGFGLCVCALTCAFNSLCSLSGKLICVRRLVFVLPLLFVGQELEDAVDSISCSYCPAPLAPRLYVPGAALPHVVSEGKVSEGKSK